MTTLEKVLEASFTKAWTVLISADIEIQAYKKTVANFIERHPECAKELSDSMASERQSTALLETTREKYAFLLKTFFQIFPDPSLEETQVLDRLKKLEELPR
jgi:hypothetical protein